MTRRKPRVLTSEQQAIADRLNTRATELRADAEADGGHLTIRQAVDVAAIELGLAPDATPAPHAPKAVPPPHTSDELKAAARWVPEAAHVYPCRVAICCDDCGHTETHEYVVPAISQASDRHDVARAHLNKHGWDCAAARDLCPDCR